MKKSNIVLLLAALIMIPLIFCGCSLFSLLGLTGTEQLAAPGGIELSEDCSYIEWNTVNNATKYEVYVNGTKVGETNLNIYYFIELDGDISLQIKALADSHKYTESELSEAVSLNVKSRLQISGISHLIDDDSFYVFWADNLYKLKYIVKIYEDGVFVEEKEVFNPSISLASYDTLIEYGFTIKAVADESGKRVDSADTSYTVAEGSAASTAEIIEYDKNDGVDAVMDNINPTAARIYLTISGTRTDITSDCVITSEAVTISSEFLDELIPNVYSGDFDVARKRFTLIVSDTRELTAENSAYVKNYDYAEVEVEIYNNTIIGIDISGAEGHASYDLITQKILVDGDYLDTLADDTYIISVEYGQGSETKTTSASLSVVSLPATIPAATSYNYHGQYPLTVTFSQRGDTVTSLILADYGTVNTSNYQKAKNSITINQDFLLARGNGTFLYCINTEKGSALSFTVITDIRDFALQYNEYTYDKASGSDMVIGAIIAEPEDFEGMYGASITEDDYDIDTESGIIIDSDFVGALSRGEYEFICISDGIEDYFNLTVMDSVHKPYDVKLNYDIDSNVYITFKSDSAGSHTYSLNGGPETLCSSKKILLTGYNKNTSNTLRITCVASGLQTTVTKSVPAAAALAYVGSRYTFEGENRDKYIESQEELKHYLRYLVFNGYDASHVDALRQYSYVEGSCYLSAEFISGTTVSAALNAALASFTPPWGYQVNSSASGNRVDVEIQYSQYPGYDVTTEYTGSSSLDTRDFLSASTRGGSFDDFYIEEANKSQTVRNTLELVELPLGVRPVVASGSDAEELYEAAKDICREIIDDSMTEAEKVAAIYYWLSTNVAYDSDAILLYNLFLQVNSLGSVASMRSAINSFLAGHSEYDDFLNPIKEKDTISELKAEFNSSIKRMRVFAAEGAIIDSKAVCNGIAYAFLLLCKIEGINCIKVSGTAFSGSQSENHAWNKVELDGVWYVVDATWGRMGNFVSHKYLMVSDYSLFETHREEAGINGIRNIDSVASGYNDYYSTIIIGAYDLSIDSIDELESVVAELYSDGVRTIELKYNIPVTFSTAIEDALEGVHIGSFQTVNSGNVYIVNLN